MIGALKGFVAATGPDRLVVDVSGVAYVVACGNRLRARVNLGGAVQLLIETQVREDSIKLYGFENEAQRAWFVRLQEVSGVGAKVALAILDVLSPQELTQAILLHDKAAVGRASGVGPKLAERIVMELKAKPAENQLVWHKGPYGGFAGATLVQSADEEASDAAINGSTLAHSHDDQMDDLRKEAFSALTNLGLDRTEAMAAIAAAIGQMGQENETIDLSGLIKNSLKQTQSKRQEAKL